MYESEMQSRQEDSGVAKSNVDDSVFQDFVLPMRSLTTGSQSAIGEGLKLGIPQSAGEQSSDKGITPIQKVRSGVDVQATPDWYDLHQGTQKPTPTLESSTYPSTIPGTDKPNAENGRRKIEAHIKSENAVPPRSDLKTGEEAIKEYVHDIPKLVSVATGNPDTAFELKALLKGSNLTASVTLARDTPAIASWVEMAIVFQPKDANWQLHVNSNTGVATAFKFNDQTKEMEPTPAAPLLEHVSMTMRSVMAIKCFRDGDVDAGRTQLKTLIEDGVKLGAEERLKKILETEADLIYKPARLRAVTREDFNKILSETQRTARPSKKR